MIFACLRFYFKRKLKCNVEYKIKFFHYFFYYPNLIITDIINRLINTLKRKPDCLNNSFKSIYDYSRFCLSQQHRDQLILISPHIRLVLIGGCSFNHFPFYFFTYRSLQKTNLCPVLDVVKFMIFHFELIDRSIITLQKISNNFENSQLHKKSVNLKI